MTVTAYVGVGSNLSDGRGTSPLLQCRRAVAQIAAALGDAPVAVSSWYRSAPVPASSQPDFINGVVAAPVRLDLLEFLRVLQHIEIHAGRVRAERNAARTLDLDIIAVDGVAVDGLVRDTPTLILPHPRMHERAFVLAPLAEIAPQWRHPLLGATAAELLGRVAAQRIERLTA